jgi:hypothetical protein
MLAMDILQMLWMVYGQQTTSQFKMSENKKDLKKPGKIPFISY